METLELAPAPYDGLAPAYDVLTARYRHDRWLAAIEQLALECGLRGRRVLDVACGTGKSFLPLLGRGYEVTACDVSPGMVAEAQRKADGRATVYVADMRCLPPAGPFDLVTCLDDAINHLQSADEVLDALSGMYANLAPGGLLAFDVNTLAAYRASGDFAVEEGEHVVVWHGREAVLSAPGSQVRVLVDVFAHAEDDLWRRTTTEQCHRHYPLPEIERLLQVAGFQLVARRGQLPGVRLEPDPDENAHPKALFVARRPVTAEH